MTPVSNGAAEGEAVLRDELASCRLLLTLSMVVIGSRDEVEILRIATTTVPSLGGCRTEAVHLDGDWRLVGSVGRPDNADRLHAQLATLDRSGGAVDVDGTGWAWAYHLVGSDGMAGHLVVGCDTEPEPHHRFLLNVLVQHTGVALVNARSHAREQAGATRE